MLLLKARFVSRRTDASLTSQGTGAYSTSADRSSKPGDCLARESTGSSEPSTTSSSTVISSSSRSTSTDRSTLALTGSSSLTPTSTPATSPRRACLPRPMRTPTWARANLDVTLMVSRLPMALKVCATSRLGAQQEWALTSEPPFSIDTILVIWYRPHFTTTDANKYQARAQQDAQYIPPNLGKAGHQKLVLRARSKLERDSWAWAINLEIERLARRRKEREDRIRAAGNVL